MEEEFTISPWYFDEFNDPLCPSFWLDFECDRANCPFSHNEGKYQSEVPLRSDIADHSLEQYTYLKNHIAANPHLVPLQEIRLAPLPEEEKDFERINQLMNEMLNFEKGPEIFDSHVICPLLKETGNCIIKDHCEFAHSEDDQKIKDIEREQEWYPGSMSCECCKGYVYGCAAEECRKSGKCLLCTS